MASIDCSVRDAKKWFALAEKVVDGREISNVERVELFRQFAESGLLASLEPALPLLLNLKNKPFTLSDHAPFSPLYRFNRSRKRVLKTGRQVSKSTSIAADGLLFANIVSDRTILYITPLFEQIRRFSNNYMRPFIDTSPIKALWSDTTTENSVLQRSFKNRSKMIFSFAGLDADRTRGIPTDRLAIDEFQDIMLENVDIIEESMGYSPWRLCDYTGTPKTLEGPLQVVWERSSQAEWFVPCFHCTTGGTPTQNIPSLDFHLNDMIGPHHEDISEERPGTVCHKCGSPINPRFGRWIHRYKDRRWEFAGYHVPQIIMPRHYANAESWSELLAKREYKPPGTFHNEVLGESYDTASKLVSLTDLNRASCLNIKNTPKFPSPAVIKRSAEYVSTALGIDWGGGGKKRVSYTTIAHTGMRGDGKIDCLWGTRLLTPHDHIGEASKVLELLKVFKPNVIAHDYTGAGALRETFLLQAGVPIEQIMPCAYMGSASHGMIRYIKASETNPRAHYIVDKTRSLLCTTNALKLLQLRFFKPDYRSPDAPGLLRDFLALIDEKVETSSTAGIYVIKRMEGFSDDFAHSVNLGCIALWHLTQMWPAFAEAAEMVRMTPEQLMAVSGPEDGWPIEDAMDGFLRTP